MLIAANLVKAYRDKVGVAIIALAVYEALRLKGVATFPFIGRYEDLIQSDSSMRSDIAWARNKVIWEPPENTPRYTGNTNHIAIDNNLDD